jgi:hypothetical protein
MYIHIKLQLISKQYKLGECFNKIPICCIFFGKVEVLPKQVTSKSNIKV